MILTKSCFHCLYLNHFIANAFIQQHRKVIFSVTQGFSYKKIYITIYCTVQ